VWGTSFRTRHRPLDGAAYDPVSDSWRMIAEGPIELTDAVGVWTGTEMIVFGAALHGGNFPETPTAIGAAYNPVSDTWRPAPESDIDPNANTASWLHDRLIAWDYSSHTSAYSPGSDTWVSLMGPPVDECEDVPRSVTAEGFVFGQLCGELVVMRPGEDGWHNVTRRDLPFWPAPFAPAEDLVFVLGFESFDQGGATKMFAFRPPSSFACGGFAGVHEAELAVPSPPGSSYCGPIDPRYWHGRRSMTCCPPPVKRHLRIPRTGWAGCSPTSRSTGSNPWSRSQVRMGSGSECACTTCGATRCLRRNSPFGLERICPATSVRFWSMMPGRSAAAPIRAAVPTRSGPRLHPVQPAR
jgi:hypothetical protein